MIYYPHSWVIDSSRVFPGPFSYYMVEKKWHRFAFDASALPRARLSRASAYFVDGLSIFIFFFTHYHHIWRIFRLLFSSSGHIHDPQDVFPLSDETGHSEPITYSFTGYVVAILHWAQGKMCPALGRHNINFSLLLVCSVLSYRLSVHC